MRRRLFNVGAAVSAVLFAGVVVLWVRSYWVVDVVGFGAVEGPQAPSPTMVKVARRVAEASGISESEARLQLRVRFVRTRRGRIGWATYYGIAGLLAGAKPGPFLHRERVVGPPAPPSGTWDRLGFAHEDYRFSSE